MIISNWAVRNRTTVFFLTLLIIITGILSYEMLPRESEPDVPIPFVFVTTNYRGGSPEDIEKLITIPIEDKLKGLGGVKEIKSSSEDGLSMISVEFNTGINIDDVMPKVKDKVDLAGVDLPVDLEDDPVITEMNFSEMPILTIGLSGDFGARQLGKLAEDFKDDLEGIPGVLEVEMAGKVDREIQVQVFPHRITQYNLNMRTVADVVGSENQNVSGGSIRLDQGRFQLQVPGEFDTPGEASELILPGDNQYGPVYLRDVGTIVDGLKDRDTASRVNGHDAITLSVKKQSGANVIKLVDAVNELLAERQKQWPKGLQVKKMMDKSKDIRNMVSDLENNILSGLLLVIIVVCFAMGIRNAVIVSLSIPLSMLIAFIILQMLGITLNMVVLFSLTLALGMLVDNAIVIVENIYRFMQQGVSRREAAMKATGEVAWPIIGSALTTIVAFVPLLWWDGIMGGFMVYLPKTVIVTLVGCLFVAIIINPAIAATVMKAKRIGGRSSADDVLGSGEHPMLTGGGKILTNYRKILNFALKNRILVVISSVIVVILMMQFWFIRIGYKNPMELFPTPDPADIYVNFNMPQGCGLSYSDNLVKSVAKKVYDKAAAEGGSVMYEKAITLKEHKYALSGETYKSPSAIPDIEYSFEKSSFKPGQQFFGPGSENQIGLHFVDIAQRTIKSTETKKMIEDLVEGTPGAEVAVESAEAGPPTGKPINIEISGEDFKTLGLLSDQIKERVKRVPYIRNLRSDFESGLPTLEIAVDRKKAAYLGLSTNLIGYIIRSAFNGSKVSNYREGDQKYDLVVRFDDENRSLIDTLRQVFIVTEKFGRVPLTTVADIRYTGGLGRITHIDNRRVVTVSADVDTTKTTGAVALAQAVALLKGGSKVMLSQIKDWDAFMKALQLGVKPDGSPVIRRIVELLPSSARTLVQSWPIKDFNTQQKSAIVDGLNLILANPEFYNKDVFANQKISAQTSTFLNSGGKMLTFLESDELERINRDLLDSALGSYLDASDMKPIIMPTGYTYHFTGENEEQVKAQTFLSVALSVAMMLILFVLVSQFNSVLYPIIIMSAVFLSLGGVFLGLGIAGLPFGTIMTGVGVISLAGVVVNNAIVLVDYIIQLQARGYNLHDAIVAAGATRLRPVILTAITTVLGLIPMATGVSYDFRNWEIQWTSESSQWWASMAIPVIFGLLVATVLTLVVVPTLLSLLTGFCDHMRYFGRDLAKINLVVGYQWIKLYDYFYKTKVAESWKRRKLREFVEYRRD